MVANRATVAIPRVLRDAENTFDASDRTAHRSTDDAANDAAHRACRAVAGLGAILISASDALCLRRKRHDPDGERQHSADRHGFHHRQSFKGGDSA